ncbi:MAG: family 10 glycosylhydrolase [Candidatus Hydrogenedentes bacterium]|nr:family 10 glycosylhydrolase [Candidatus Hydrogenedentota bacterium]
MKRNFGFINVTTALTLVFALTTLITHAQAQDPQGMTIEQYRAARKEAAHKQRRIIMNNDGNDARTKDQEHTVDNFLMNRSTPLAGSQVDAIFYCTGVFNLYTQPSTETELRGHGDKESLDWAWELTKLGTDSLTEIIKFAHANKMEAFWSMRMNDTHDSGDNALLCKWKQDHPDYLMGKKGDKFPHGGGRWSAVNYGLPEVRDKVFRILADVCTRYDVDGLELDFFRHPVYFKPQMTGEPVTQEHCDMMTELIRRVRVMTEDVGKKRGRPVLISIRVPDSLGYAQGIGLDWERWLKEDLVDIVSLSGYFHLEPWENMVAIGKKYDAPVYACLSGSRVVSPSNPEGGREDAKPLWRGEARAALEAGVSGIYTFNLFSPKSELFREMGSLDTLPKADGPYKQITGDPKTMERWLKGGSGFLKLPL